MTNEDVQALVETISLTIFHRPFRHRAYFNPRLKTTGGRYMLQTGNIELNRSVLTRHGEEELRGVIQHELCHYHLHQQGKGYRHGDEDFKQLLRATNSPRYCKPLAPRAKSTKRYTYRCTKCDMTYVRKRKMSESRYRCGKCRSPIRLVQTEEV